jgi:lysophospholipase L1-like esterase
MPHKYKLITAVLLLITFGNSTQRVSAADTPRIRITLVGDSTVTDTAGWGKGFASCLTPNVECINMAKGGRSSRSYVVEGSWKLALATKPDYMLIQFGHNDQPGHPDRQTDMPTYRTYMSAYVDDARAAGIKPILVTSLSRRQWGPDGKIHSTLQPWADVVKDIAAQKNVPLIDLHARSIEFYESQGRDKLYELSPIKNAQPSSTPAGANLADTAPAPAPGQNKVYDGTHLNAKGGQVIGRIVADELKKAVPDLVPYIR